MKPYRVFREIDPAQRPGEMVLVSEHDVLADAMAAASASPFPCTVENADGGSADILAVNV